MGLSGYDPKNVSQHDGIVFTAQKNSFRVSGRNLIGEMSHIDAPMSRMAAVPENSLAYRAAIQALMDGNQATMERIIDQDGRKPDIGLCLVVAYTPAHTATSGKAGLVSYPIRDIRPYRDA